MENRKNFLIRVGRNYRALAMEDNEGYIWVWIGNHAEYERLLTKQPPAKAGGFV